MEFVSLSPQVLNWAASQAGSTLPELARKISRGSAEQIENGNLTGAQAIRFSKMAGVPLGYLFFEPDISATE